MEMLMHYQGQFMKTRRGKECERLHYLYYYYTRHMQSILGASLIELAALCWHSSGGNVGCYRGGRRMLPTEVGQAASEAGD